MLDKAVGDDAKAAAHEIFQQVAFAYAILSEPGRRSRYDATGSTDEAANLEDGSFDWTSFYRNQFEGITASRINEFSENYKGSEEEKADLIGAYNKYKGNMGKIYETVLLSNVLEDDQRFRATLDQAIEDGEINGLDAYLNESEESKARRLVKAAREAEEAKEALKKTEGKAKTKKSKANDNLSDLAALIQNKNKNKGGSFLDALEAKYAAGPRKGKRAAAGEEGVKPFPGEPSEEEFQAARAKLEKSKAKQADSSSGTTERRSKRTKS